MEVACFKYIRKELQQGTNWTIVTGRRDGEDRSVYLREGDVGEMERKMRAFLFDHLIQIHSSCNIHFRFATIIRKARGDFSFFFSVGTPSFLHVLSFSSDCCPPQDDCQRICCLIGLYLNVNCNCFNTVCSFTDLSCNITLYSGSRITRAAEKNVTPVSLSFFFSIFCNFFFHVHLLCTAFNR